MLVIIAFGDINRNCFLKVDGLKFDVTQLFDVTLNI